MAVPGTMYFYGFLIDTSRTVVHRTLHVRSKIDTAVRIIPGSRFYHDTLNDIIVYTWYILSIIFINIISSLQRRIRSRTALNPFRAPEPLPILNPSNFVPKNGFPVVKGLTKYELTKYDLTKYQYDLTI